MLAFLFENDFKVQAQFSAECATKSREKNKSDVKYFISYFSISDGLDIQNIYSVFWKYLTS